jgi:hypothetical protein
MKKLLLPVLVASVLSLSAMPLRAALIYEDDFDDGDPATNGYAGNFIQDNGASPMVEVDGSVQWGPDGGGDWGGSNIQSLDEFTFPKADEKYTVEWTIGPMAVTAPGESWGDIRMQFILMSKNSPQGAGAGSAEFWSMTAGALGVDLVYKNGNNLFANFVAKNDTIGANANAIGVAGQTNHQIDPTQDNVLMIELTSSEASLYVNGTLSQTVPLFQWDLGAGPGEEYENGFYVLTRSARANTGRGTMSVKRVSVALESAEPPPPPPVPTMTIQPSSPGLQLFSTNGQYDRQTVRTTVPEYSWVGANGPVTYSVTIADYPATTDHQTVMYLVPSGSLPVTSNSPDWSEPICAVVYINSVATGGGNMRFAYKNHLRESNGMTGHDYWTNDNGDVYTGEEDPPLGAAGTGMGGSLAFVNSSAMLGTWSVTFSDATTVELTAPDGSTATGTMLPETAALFAGPLYVYFGTVPQTTGNIGYSALFSQISISGVANPISESFTAPIDPAVLEISASNPAGVLQIIPAQTPYWLRWTVPDTGYKPQQSATLTATPPWQEVTATSTLLLRGEKWLLLPTTSLLDPKNAFFRLRKQ